MAATAFGSLRVATFVVIVVVAAVIVGAVPGIAQNRLGKRRGADAACRWIICGSHRRKRRH